MDLLKVIGEPVQCMKASQCVNYYINIPFKGNNEHI